MKDIKISLLDDVDVSLTTYQDFLPVVLHILIDF